MRQKVADRTKRGDTLIEVMLSISIFSLVAMITINLMNDGINTAQRTLEAEMARNEIDAQAEALRFIHSGYVAERQRPEGSSQFRDIWKKITKRASVPEKAAKNVTGVPFDINEMNSCADAYASKAHLDAFKAFAINTRLVMPKLSSSFNYLGLPYSDLIKYTVVYKDKGSTGTFSAPSLYPRIVYGKLNGDGAGKSGLLDEGGEVFNKIQRAEGIWIDAVKNDGVDGKDDAAHVAYYDFYIRTCWQAAGRHVPSTITTVVRLYNPEATN